MRVVSRKTVVGDWCFDYLSSSHLQSQVKSLHQMMVTFMPFMTLKSLVSSHEVFCSWSKLHCISAIPLISVAPFFSFLFILADCEDFSFLGSSQEHQCICRKTGLHNVARLVPLGRKVQQDSWCSGRLQGLASASCWGWWVVTAYWCTALIWFVLFIFWLTDHCVQ